MELYTHFESEPLVRKRDVNSQSQITIAGEYIRNLIIIKRGFALPYRVNLNGTEVGLGVVGPNSIYGLEYIEGKDEHINSLRSITDCELLKIPVLTFKRMVTENTQLALMVFEQIEKQASVSEAMAKVVTERVPQRTAMSVLQMYEQMGSMLNSVENYDIAVNAGGLPEETAWGAVKALEKIGAIAVDGKIKIVTNPAVLGMIAEGKLKAPYQYRSSRKRVA